MKKLQDSRNEILINEENKRKKEDTKKKIKAIFQELKELDPSLSEIKSVKKMISALEEMKNNRKIFKCPSCNEYLSMNSQDKISVSKVKKTVRCKIGRKPLEDLYSRLNIANQNWAVDIYEYDLTLDEVETQIETLSSMKGELDKLRSENVNSIFEERETRLKEKIGDGNYEDCKKNIQKIEAQIEKLKRHETEIKKTKKDISSTETQIKKIKQQIEKFKHEGIEDELKTLSKYEQEISKLSSEISNITSNLLCKKESLEKLEMTKGLCEYKRELEVINEKENTLRESASLLKGYTKLKDIHKHAEICSLKRTIGTINENANIYLSHFFQDKPINVEIRESEKRQDQLGVEISFRGHLIDKTDILSGGEMQKCDLAFLFGVNDIRNGPLILLDECFSFISGPGHTDVITTLTSMCKNRLVILVSHRAIEGDFSGVVNL